MSSNGREYHETGANAPAPDAGSKKTLQTYEGEAADSITVDSGTASWTFDALRGGRLDRWQWRTTPPPELLDPMTRHNPPRPFELVDGKYGALVDHFLPLGTTYLEVAEGTNREFGDFVDTPYVRDSGELGGETRVIMMRDGSITAGKRVAEVRIIKSMGVRAGTSDLSVLYRVINSSSRPVQILFAVEYNLYAPGLAEDPQGAEQGSYLVDGAFPEDPSLSSVGMSVAATSLALSNPRGEMGLQLGWDRECDLWRMPGRDGGSSVRVLAVWRLSIIPGDNWALGLWLAPG